MSTESKPIDEKKEAIRSHVVEIATRIIKLSKIAFPPKRAFRKIDRRPLKRIKRQRAKADMLLLPFMMRVRAHIISATPIPKFPLGSSGGPAIVDDAGKEVFVNSDGKIKIRLNNK